MAEKIKIFLNGRSDVKNYVLNSKVINGSGFKGIYGFNHQSKRKLINVSRFYQYLVEKHNWDFVFITLTFPDYYDNSQRDVIRAKFTREISERSRKSDIKRFFVWVTEKHKSGKFHYHLVLVTSNKLFERKTDYKTFIKLQSMEYCNVKNAIDIEFPENFDMSYVTKYVSKGMDSQLTNNKHLYGYSRFKKNIIVDSKDIEDVPAFSILKNGMYVYFENWSLYDKFYNQNIFKC